MVEEVQKHSLHTLTFRSIKRGCEMFLKDGLNDYEPDPKSWDLLLKCKIQSDYGAVRDIVDNNPAKRRRPDGKAEAPVASVEDQGGEFDGQEGGLELVPVAGANSSLPSTGGEPALPINRALVTIGDQNLLVPRKAQVSSKPEWHAPWKLARVISGHGGWVRCAAVEPGNEWFATGSADRIIKIWDLHSGQLKLSLTGHVSAVRGLAVGIHQPYLFSCGEDKQVKCWDLEYNKVIRHYHGHLSAVYGLDIHPSLDFLVTCGRDATSRLWDVRTKVQIHCLMGHTSTVSQVRCQASEPQIISTSHDSTIRLWDIVAGKTKATLTNHKKSVRALALHPYLNMMATGSTDNLKQWKFPEGVFIQNLSGHNSIVNTLAVNNDNVLVSGGDNGSLFFWDWTSGHNFQRLQSLVQPGSIESEAGILAMTFDKSGSRLITCESDKTIKVYVEDSTATEETHPLNWKSEVIRRRF